jgi:hypothetical protein
MSAPSGETFRIPVLPWIGVLMAIAAAALPLAWPDTTVVLAMLGTIVLLTSYSLWVFKLIVHDDGIVMYRLNRMMWSEVQSARFRRVVGLPYLHVRRQHGMAWWLPLYFRGARDLRCALIERAPEGNPIPRCLKQVM